MFREPNQPQPSSAFASSDRLRIRTGLLARTAREDADAVLESREPDELFGPAETTSPPAAPPTPPRHD